ncbi:sulfatase-like hydrolase/transferase [Aquabacterium sp. G14]|uniref:LTA synthase family protein n=1 Tax=Aquabacterium sp. G14 TaxID=3130164 RepID=UPI0030B467CB
MKQVYSPSKWGRWHSYVSLLALFVVLGAVLRALLWLKTGGQAPWTPALAARVFGVGLVYDLVAGASLLMPLMLFLAVVPSKWLARRGFRIWLALGMVVWVALMLFIGISEWIFWDEFGSRFNFIAVDYLLYTHEVIGNIRESYPVGVILSALALVATALVWQGRRALVPRPDHDVSRWARWGLPVAVVGAVSMAHAVVDGHWKEQSSNRYVNALSGDGVYEFFSALRHNELDYEHFYQSLPPPEAMARLRKQLPTPHARLASNDPMDLTRIVDDGQPEKHLNVVLISVESLSADYLAHFGNQRGLTPRLDALAEQGLLFTRLYATGTRTVRGLEALSLSLPPTPGQSIVKRPGNADLFSLGSVFASKGYDTRYVYGGYGYFDNMNAFFSANHYQVVDRMAIPAERIHHENIWGVADEDLFTQALQEADASHARGKPSFMHVMTTSNHRPYTYPEGRIDIPSHQSREGGVKYTDWAIGNFLDRAAQKPWFKDTVFVIVADHCASSAGKTDLPVERYHIPALIYAPGHIAPAKVDRLASQIDIAPTLLGLLHFKYESRFLGYDLFDLEPGRERAFISTYQDLGYLTDHALVRLDSRGGVQTTQVADGEDRGRAAPMTSSQVADAISWYQGAAWAYHHEGLSLKGLRSPSYAGLAGRR